MFLFSPISFRKQQIFPYVILQVVFFSDLRISQNNVQKDKGYRHGEIRKMCQECHRDLKKGLFAYPVFICYLWVYDAQDSQLKPPFHGKRFPRLSKPASKKLEQKSDRIKKKLRKAESGLLMNQIVSIGGQFPPNKQPVKISGSV